MSRPWHDFAATIIKLINETYEKLSKEFEMKDLGHVKEFLGIEIHKTDNGYAINQSKYISKIANELQLSNAKP